MQHLQRQLGSVEYNGKNIAPLEDKGLQHTGFHHLHVRQDLGFKLNTEISTEEEKKSLYMTKGGELVIKANESLF